MKYSAANHKFAVIQDGYCVFGVGRTEEMAIEDAARCIEFENGLGTIADVRALLKNKYNHVDGDFYLENDPIIIKQYVLNQ